MVQLSPDRNCEVITLGSEILNGEKLQHVWFGAIPNETYGLPRDWQSTRTPEEFLH